MVAEDFKNVDLMWEQCDHDWDGFGVLADTPETDTEELFARPLVTWKKISLYDFVNRIAKAVFKAERFGEN